jgi:hypothetical protein
MKHLKEKLISSLLVMALLIGMMSSPVQAETSENSLENLNISWNLKNNKAVSFKDVIGKSTQKGKSISDSTLIKIGTVTMTDYKVTDSDKEGYKKLSFKIVFKLSPKLSKKTVDKMFYYNHYKSTDPLGDLSVVLADYETGEDLSASSVESDVSVSYGEFKTSGARKYSGSGGREISIAKKIWVKVTAEYPEIYENLCILAGGTSNHSKKTNSLIKNTNLYSKKDKLVCHGFRVK